MTEGRTKQTARGERSSPDASTLQTIAGGGLKAPRVLGSAGDGTGPVFVCVAGLHGNEPSGLIAVARILRKIGQSSIPIRGTVLALTGNIGALSLGIRYRVRDLNRAWTAERVRELRSNTERSSLEAEDREQLELLELVDEVLESATDEVYFIDLHTTSAESAPFAIIADTLRNRDFALNLPLPIILGLEEQVEGTLLEYVGGRGAITLGFEAGEHRSAASIERQEAVIWLALVLSKMLKTADCTGLEGHRNCLSIPTSGLPRFLEVRFRHPVEPGDSYATIPGFTNFQRIEKGTKLAFDHRGPIHSPEDGLLLMPLYQDQGEDGFFVVKPVLSLWLHLSRLLRRLRLEKLLPWLPGVRRDTVLENALVVNRRIARWRVLELFHLLGYRKRKFEEDRIVVARRRHDSQTPFPLDTNAGR